MDQQPILHLNLHHQVLGTNAHGYTCWETHKTEKVVPAANTALILCDMWDQHWSRGCTERVAAMAPHMNHVIAASRASGVHIIHAPSETMEFYAGTPARQRMVDAPHVSLPPQREHVDPPLPIDDSDDGSDTGEEPPYKAWSRQHVALEIDQRHDGISDDGVEIFNFVQQHNITQLLIMGVATNMCILNRSFGIKRMVRWGLPIALVRDFTDTMYNPARAPYVSHDEGTRLTIEYIEKFWCPTITSSDLTGIIPDART